MPEFDLAKIREILSLELPLEERAKKIDEIYPDCFKSKEFAKFVALNKSRIEEKVIWKKFYDLFDISAQYEILKGMDYWGIFEIAPDSLSNLEEDILNNLSDEEYEKLELSDDAWLDYTAALMPRTEEDLGKNVEGFRISYQENEYLEDGEVQNFTGPVGIFVPLDNFKEARIDFWNYRDKENEAAQQLVEMLSPVVESIRTLPYKNMNELIQYVYLSKNIETLMAVYHENLVLPPEKRNPNFNTLCDAIDAYIVQYGGAVDGIGHGDVEFTTTRLFNHENETTPVVVSSISKYDGKSDGSGQEDVWIFYDKDGKADSTYTLDGFFPSEENVREYLETGSIEINLPELQTLVAEYCERLSRSQHDNNITIAEVAQTVSNQRVEKANAVINELEAELRQKEQKDGQAPTAPGE